MNGYRNDERSDEIIRAALKDDESAIKYLESLDTTDVEIPAHTDRKIRRRIKKFFREKNKTKAARSTKKTLVAVLAAALLAVCLCLSVGAIRNTVLDAVLSWYENCIEYKFSPTGDKNKMPGPKEPSYVPVTVVEKIYDELGKAYGLRYLLDDGLYIVYEQYPKQLGLVMWIDNEGVTKSTVKINRAEGELYTYADGRVHLVWDDDENVYGLFGDAGAITPDEVIKMAESVE